MQGRLRIVQQKAADEDQIRIHLKVRTYVVHEAWWAVCKLCAMVKAVQDAQSHTILVTLGDRSSIRVQ